MNKNPLIVIFLTVFIDLIGFGIIIPLSPYLARAFGATALQVGLLMAIYSAMQFLFSPLWGGLSDRIGRRPVLLISIGGTALAHLLFYYAHNMELLFLARFLAGLFSANISTAMAYIADHTSDRERSKSMGLIGAAFGLGFICGPALGGLVTGENENLPALIAALISTANFILAFFILRESLPPEKRQPRVRKNRLKNIVEKIQRPVVGTLLFGMFAISFAMANMEATLFLFVQDRFGWGIRLASFGFAYVGVCIAVTQGLLVRKILPRIGERGMLVTGFLFFTIGMLLTGFSQSIAWLAVSMTLLALGNGFVNPSLNGGISLLTPPTEQGEVMGVSQSLAALARILGPPLGGFLYMHFAQATPFLFASSIGAVGFLLVWLVKNRIPNAGRTADAVPVASPSH